MTRAPQDRHHHANALRAARGALTAAEFVEYRKPSRDGARAVLSLRAAVRRLELACAAKGRAA